MTSSIIDVSNILSSQKSSRWVAKELGRVKVKTTDEQSKIFDLIIWLKSNGDDIMELVKIVMSLVNPLDSDGPTRKKEARFLFTKILEIAGQDDNLDFYLNIFDSAVEVIIWAKKGGLEHVIKTSKGCLPCFKKTK